jgi:seryl-tRNA synthetase
MHDIRSIRENPAAFDQGLRNRGMEPLSERLIALDDQRKSAISALQAAT